MTTTRTTADNPFAAHSLSVLRDFAEGRMGQGPWTRGPGQPVWGTMDQARAELEHRKAVRRSARRSA